MKDSGKPGKREFCCVFCDKSESKMQIRDRDICGDCAEVLRIKLVGRDRAGDVSNTRRYTGPVSMSGFPLPP